MCFMERGSLVGGWFLWQQITAFRKGEILVGDFFADRKLFSEKEIVSDENAKFQTFCTQKHLAKSQNLYLPHRFGLAPSHGFALSFPPTHTIFLSHRRKDNVQFFF